MFGTAKKYCEPKVTYTIVQDVQQEVISVCETKEYMVIDFDDFDKIIPMFIKGAIEEAEKYTGLSIGERKIKLSGDYKAPGAYMPFAPYSEPDAEGLQDVGYSKETIPGDLKIALLNMIHTSFNDRENGMTFNLTLLDRSRRRVGL